MKQATQFALYGTIAIIIERAIYILSNLSRELFGLDIMGFVGSKIYIALNTIEMIGFVAIANFFYVLYQKQNNKNNSNE